MGLAAGVTGVLAFVSAIGSTADLEAQAKAAAPRAKAAASVTATGVSYGANLTPDKETGLGNWTEEMFISALRKGRHAGAGRRILPPMPWTAYAQMSDQDLKAIFAYLRSVKPIKNAVPPPAPPIPAL